MSAKLSARDLAAYGLFGLPLAMVALPIYVHVPQFYAERFGLPLSSIGITLLAARLLDAFADPAIGAWIDRAKNRSGFDRFILMALPLLTAGFTALFHPPRWMEQHAFIWFAASLVLVYLGFSLATIAYQSWGAALTQARAERSQVTAAREGCGLVGVVLAAALPGWLGFEGLLWLFAITIAISAWLLLASSRRPPLSPVKEAGATSLRTPFRSSRFRWLFAVFAVNGIAAAIPATLFFFFAKDRLQLGDQAGLYLVLYFAAGAVSMPAWVSLARRVGEARAWLAAMLLSIAAFIWSFWLPVGAGWQFGLICALSGLALGADLAFPAALLAAVIAHAGHSGQREGAYFGVWNWATKMNLALAAGIALPLLERLGYVPGAQDMASVQALGIAYAILPCMLKFAAAALLWRAPLRHL